ncbi:hypothetical protein B0H14DRAFT_3508454 [Mycena olivaceomarginata]|nr:hypothetical protein B0H14DRAFT_3508454 [Mycena olivaceomarginata]
MPESGLWIYGGGFEIGCPSSTDGSVLVNRIIVDKNIPTPTVLGRLSIVLGMDFCFNLLVFVIIHQSLWYAEQQVTTDKALQEL